MSNALKYLSAYSASVQSQVQQMLEQKTLSKYLLTKYPNTHDISNDKSVMMMLINL